MKIRYYVCGLGYDVNGNITDYEQNFGDFDTYVEAYELFVKLQCRSPKSFFENTSGINQLLLQVEECEETDDTITCIDVKNEWWIVNPNFKEDIMSKKIYAVNLCYYTEENVPECGAVIFIRSDQDITKLPKHIIKEDIFVAEAMENNDCDGIGNIFEITEEEFYEEYPNEYLIEI